MNPKSNVIPLRNSSLADENLDCLAEVAAILAEHGFKPVLIFAEHVDDDTKVHMMTLNGMDELATEKLLEDSLEIVRETQHTGRC